MACQLTASRPDHLSSRFTGTCWEPLLWAAPWLWRISGNPFLDRDGDDYPEPEPWSASSVFHLTAQYREALRIMRAVDEFDTLAAPRSRPSALAPPCRRRWARPRIASQPSSICPSPSCRRRARAHGAGALKGVTRMPTSRFPRLEPFVGYRVALATEADASTLLRLAPTTPGRSRVARRAALRHAAATGGRRRV